VAVSKQRPQPLAVPLRRCQSRLELSTHQPLLRCLYEGPGIPLALQRRMIAENASRTLSSSTLITHRSLHDRRVGRCTAAVAREAADAPVELT